jgi:hypothetical protein
MKLHSPSWKSAWYEEGLSERFAQEMSRLEKTVIKEIETSAQWVEQLVIELGMLAQNMIHLEGEARRDSQIRLAFEKALKVSALSAHLMGALDQAVDRGPALLRYSNEVAGDRPASTGAAHDNALAAAAPSLAAPLAAAGAAPASAAPAAPASPATPPPAGMRSNAVAQVGIRRQAVPREVPPAAPRPAGPTPMVTSLMDISHPMVQPSGNPMREMILSLSRRGLSRSEIEVITEQPRHVIEAVLTAG